MDCIFQPDIAVALSGHSDLQNSWHGFFKNNNPIVLELGCGKGEYTVAQALKYPDKNFIGVDVKGARIWVGAKIVEEQKIPNAAFLRTKIEFVQSFFGQNEIDEVWLTFSDPQVRNTKGNKRLSSPEFINRYKQFLKPNAIIHVKTDSDLLYEFTLGVIKENGYELIFESENIYQNMDNFSEDMQEILSIKTHYEAIFSAKGFSIKYIQFKING